MTALLRPHAPPSNLVRAAQARLVAQLRDLDGEPTLGGAAAPEAATPWPGPLRAPAVADADGRYEFGEVFAAGGLGLVRRARDRRLGRTIAVKELLRSDPAAERRFMLEAAITARLQHPGIVPLHDIGRHPTGEPYYVMKLVDGRSLADSIRACAGLEQRLALVEHLISAADAIAYAHRHRIIHRDLKPANILIGELGETVVIDWGLAKDLDGDVVDELSGLPELPAGLDSTLTRQGTMLGTLHYMPPEQARGLPVDARSDVYALGAVLHHILAGAPPFAGLDERELAARVSAGAVLDLAALVPAAPRELVAIASRAMAPQPEHRYASAEALVDDLRRFRTGRLVGAHSYGAGEVLRRWARRHQPVIAVACAALVALAGVGGYAVQQIRGERDAATRAQAEAEAAGLATGHALQAARERGDAALLAQARGALDADPAATLRALADIDLSHGTDSTDGADGEVARSARLLAAAAQSRGAPTRALHGHARPISELHALADGGLVSLDVGGAVWRWDAKLGAGAQVLDLGEPHASLVVARDAPVFAAIGAKQARVVMADGEVRTIDLGELPRGSDDTPHYAFALSADGSTLTARTQPMTDERSPGGAAAYRWDLRGAPIVAEATAAGRRGEAAVSPDGRTVAHETEAGVVLVHDGVTTPVPALRRPLGFSSSGRHVYGFPPGPEPQISSWNRDTGELHPLGRWVLAAAPDDHVLAIDFDPFMGDAVLSLRSLATGAARWSHRFPRSSSLGQWGDHGAFAAIVDPRGVGLAIRADDEWLLGELATGRLGRTLDVGRHLRGAWLPDGDFALARGAEIWTWTRPVTPAPDLAYLAVSPAGARAVVHAGDDGQPVVLDMSSGTSVQSSCLAGRGVDELTGRDIRLAVDDLGRVFVGEPSGRACVARAGAPAEVWTLPGRATAVTLAAGDGLAVGLGDGGLLTWDTPKDPPRRRELGAEVVALRPAHAGAGLVAVTRGGVQAIDRAGAVRDIVRLPADSPRADRMAATAVVAHPRAPQIAVLLPGHDRLYLHDLASGTTQQRTLILAAPVAAFSPSGAQLAVAAAGRRVQLYTDAADPGRTVTLSEEVASLGFLDEDELAVVGDGGALLRVDARTGESATLQRHYTPADEPYRLTLISGPAGLIGHAAAVHTLARLPADDVPNDAVALGAWLQGRRAALTGG